MGRPKNRHKPVVIPITGTPKLAYYLDRIIAEEGLGNTRGEVSRNLVWQGIRQLIRDRVLDRKKGRVGEEREGDE